MPQREAERRCSSSHFSHAQQERVAPVARRNRARGSSSDASTGVTVSDTTSDASSDDEVRQPERGEHPPFQPGQGEQRQHHQADDQRGVDDRVAHLARRQEDHLAAAGSGFGFCRFSFSRRKMFSTSTMASSTSSPTATAMPPSVIVLIDTPKQRKTSTVIEDRERDGGQRDDAGAEVPQEQEQDDEHPDGAVADRLDDVVDGRAG